MSTSDLLTCKIDGKLFVVDGEGRPVHGPFKSNEEAWRWIDVQEGEPTSPAQKRSDFSWGRYLHGDD